MNELPVAQSAARDVASLMSFLPQETLDSRRRGTNLRVHAGVA
jgi:hypothetical protein